jgi:uncharacterized protein involved in type VI secretion and phage assembly
MANKGVQRRPIAFAEPSQRFRSARGAALGRTDVTLKIATPGKGTDQEWRYINGLCACFSQGDRNTTFTDHHAEIVPRVWLLTRQIQSRIFQQKSVPNILKAVFEGFDCDYQLHGRYEPREYCVQYRETDFDFASRADGGRGDLSLLQPL